MTIGSRSGKRLANVARSCGRYMYHGLILTGQTGMIIWYPPTGTEEHAGAVAPNPVFAPVETVPRMFAPVPSFAQK